MWYGLVFIVGSFISFALLLGCIMLSDELILILDILILYMFGFPTVFLTHSLSLDLYFSPSSFPIALSAFIILALFITTDEKFIYPIMSISLVRTFIDREISLLIYIWATFPYALWALVIP